MDSDRFTQKEAEFNLLKEEYAKFPELFTEQTTIDDDATLSELGISIPGKKQFPEGYLKLWPEDFIVEERIDDGIRSVANLPSEPPQEKYPTLYATLVKCNISTFEAVADMAKSLGIRPEDISFAGLKDKNALTAQKVSFRKVTPEMIRSLQSPYYYLTDWQGGKGIAERGNLAGNRFTILVRTERSFFDPELFSHFAVNLKRVKEKGFYNFFYLQRFGTSRLRNYHWAWLILRGEYEKAVHDYITFAGERELPYFKELRSSFAGDIPNWDVVYQKMLRFPIIFEQELLVVNHLRQHPTDFIGALQTLPEQITFWLYALSSMLFNKRISLYLASGEKMPEQLPFFLSHNYTDQNVYRPMLENMGLYPLPFGNLKPFPQITLKSRQTPTKSSVIFHKAELTTEGIVFEFDLAKGEYATTMLSHMFNLVGGFPPDRFLKSRIVTKALLGNPSSATTIDHFKDVIKTKGEGFGNVIE